MKKILKKPFILLLALFVLVTTLAIQISPLSVQAKETNTSTYQLWVNRAANCVTVYQKDEAGEYTVPVRSFACSTAREGKVTPLGSFKTSNYYNWLLMVDGSYGRYAVRFNNKILFHSVPYNSTNANDLEEGQFNLLGDVASLGCVRLALADEKWIYENCEPGTSVIVYEDAENPGPLGKPRQMVIPEGHPFSNWDPTDIWSEDNPWNTIRPSLYLTSDMGDGVLYVPTGSSLERLKAGVGLKNSEGQICAAGTYDIEINGNYDLNTFGVYRIWVSGFDSAGVKVEQEMLLAVV
jgi:hypothetical protein